MERDSKSSAWLRPTADGVREAEYVDLSMKLRASMKVPQTMLEAHKTDQYENARIALFL